MTMSVLDQKNCDHGQLRLKPALKYRQQKNLFFLSAVGKERNKGLQIHKEI